LRHSVAEHYRFFHIGKLTLICLALCCAHNLANCNLLAVAEIWAIHLQLARAVSRVGLSLPLGLQTKTWMSVSRA